MSYAGSLRIHDADSHIFESSDWLIRYAEPQLKSLLKPLDLHGKEEVVDRAASELGAADPETLAAQNWDALGASKSTERKNALDLLGYQSQLVFSTYSHLSFINNPGAPSGSNFTPEVLYGSVRAHNLGMVDFCSNDPRLLPVGWVAIDVPALAVKCCEEALKMGCVGVELPSYPTGELSLTHPDLHPIYEMLQSAGLPLLFHVGGGGQVANPVFAKNGANKSIIHQLTFMGINAPIELALSALVFDGIFEKFPRLMCGVIEHGANWVPGFLRRLDNEVAEFEGETFANTLALWPSDYIRRNVRITPFPFEDIGWLIRESGGSIYLFGSDYPHDEGLVDPIAGFELTLASCTPQERDQFYWKNFEELMGAGLREELRIKDETSSESQDRIDGPPVEFEATHESSVQAVETLEVSRKKALLRLLAREAGERAGVTVEEFEIQTGMDDFRVQHGLQLIADTRRWMAEQDLSEEMLVNVIRDGILLDKISAQYADQLDFETEVQARIATARR